MAASSLHQLNYEIIDDLSDLLGAGFDDVVTEQVEQAGIYLRDLSSLLGKDDTRGCMRCAHALKSSIGQIGLYGIYGLAKELETTCDADAQTGAVSLRAKELHRMIVDELPGAIAVLRAYLRRQTD